MAPFTNAAELLDHGARIRADALKIAASGLRTADPFNAAMARVRLAGDDLFVCDRRYPLTADRRVFVIGAGKASYPIAKALEEVLGDRIFRGLVVVKKGETRTLDYCGLRLAAHPIPDASSLQAADDMLGLLDEVRPRDIVIACITGGSSALLAKPLSGISIEEKAIANKVLLTCGANIQEINAVRKHLSQVKGGQLAKRLLPGTTLVNLTVSDVVGDALDYITDNTVADSSTLWDARGTLDKYRLWQRLPESVTAHLKAADSALETPKEGDLDHLTRQDVILVENDAACRGALAAARGYGYEAMILSAQLDTDSRELGRTFGAIAKEVRASRNPLGAPCAVIAGGETTVTIGESAVGTGGPNQEFALSAALEIQGMHNVAVLGLDTDGTDGPTTSAGGLVDGTTAERARMLALDLHQALAAHDATPCLNKLGDGVQTGHTGTNVNDLKILLVGRQA